MRWFRYSVKLEVLKTLSSTGLEQSMMKVRVVLLSLTSFLASFLILVSLGALLLTAYFVVIRIYNLIIK